jgi:hypothetical protein
MTFLYPAKAKGSYTNKMEPATPTGKVGPNIVPGLHLTSNRYEPPETLRQMGVGRILGREVVGWSNSLGSYGMGGPGFFGLRLARSGALYSEWLVLGAGWQRTRTSITSNVL